MRLTLKDILEDLHAAERDCQTFEKKYGMLSEYFHVAYANGALDDDVNSDFVLWAGAYEVKREREEAYRNLVITQSSLFATLKNPAPAYVEP